MNKAVFLDRDGTVIYDRGYLDNADGVELLPGAVEALQLLKKHGFLLVLITNQSGVGRGFFDLDAVAEQHTRLAELLQPYNVDFDDIQICPHAPEDECDCRKPSPSMLQNSIDKLKIDPSLSFMVGDKPSDVFSGHNAGCKGIIIKKSCPEADFAAESLLEAAQWICSGNKEND